MQTISKDGKFKLSARVAPEAGANLISFQVDGTELLFWDETRKVTGDGFSGAFNMFPTPCRLDNCTYQFDGRTIKQRKNGQDVFIHGLVRDEAFQFQAKPDRITSSIEITRKHPAYEGFPFQCRFAVTHALEPAGLTVSFRVENRDSRPLPFGYGIHPFWRIQGQRKDVLVRIPCDYILELKNLVPTGNYSPVEGTSLDLRQLRSIEGLAIDNAFWKRNPGDTAEMVFRAIGKRIKIEASDNFPHMIAYVPDGKPFLCVENLTSTPNAPNLVTAGKGEVASMSVVAPGKAEEGWIRYTIEKL